MSSLLYIKEHLKCKNYLSDNKCIFSQYTLKKGDVMNINFFGEYLFVFMLSGKWQLTYEDTTTIELDSFNMYSIGYNQWVCANSEEDSSVILLTFNKPMIYCDEFNMTGLRKHLPKQDKLLRQLPINEFMHNFLNTMQIYLHNKLLCRHLQEIKQSEFFLLMRGFYTKEENVMFLYPLIKSESQFELMVKEKVKDAKTVIDLATACNMTTKTFTRKFKEIFKVTPKQWLLKRKRKNVKIEVLRTGNFKELQKKVGFSSYTHLSGYCQKQFDKSLKDLKKES